METLVLPPEDQLARRHYWHTTACKMKGFQTLTPPPSRKQLTAGTLFSPHLRNSDSNRRSNGSKDPVIKDAYSLQISEGPQFPRGVFPGNRSGVAPLAPVAPFLSRSGENLSSLQLRDGDLYLRDSTVKDTVSVFRSEKEPKYRVSGRASFTGRTKGGLRRARSLPEKTAPPVEVFEKKTDKEKKASNKKFTEKAFQKALQNIPMEVMVLQRPKTREDAIMNLARFKGVPLPEFCDENGKLLGAKAESACRVTRMAGNLFKDVNIADPAKVCPQSPPEELLTATSFDLLSSECSKPLWASELLAEKWAGPCYTVSPPPSSLPLPKFGVQKQEPSPLRITEISPVAKQIQMDTEMATKDLRRILHLDF